MAEVPEKRPDEATNPEAGPGRVERVIRDRFRATQSLRKAQGTETLLGTDLAGGEAVIIKAVATGSLSAGARMRLEHEAALRRGVQSRWLSSLLDAGREEDVLYFVMPFLPGISLETRLRGGPLDVEETLTLGCCLFSALKDAHRHRVLHRNVKPANVIVDQHAPLTGATLVDFGLARSVQLASSLHEPPTGTAFYTSPEQAGFVDQDVGEPSDLYSAGVLLFECLAGRPPFRGDTVGAVLFEHMTVPVPELRSLRRQVPRALDELVQRLLRKDPRDRYQSAEAVLADLEAIRAAWVRGETEPSVVVGVSDQRRTLTEPAFVARQPELCQLDGQIEHARAGRAGLVLLEGESGRGKTRLLAEAAQRAVREGFWVLRGQGSSEVARRPLQSLNGVVKEFARAASSDPALAESVQTRLGVDCGALRAAFPELGDALGWETSNLVEREAFGEARTIRALSGFLDALGTRERPALIILDDGQWADELTAKLLQRWWTKESQARPEPRYVVLIVAVRSEDVPDDHLLRRLRPSAHLQLSALEPEDVRRLAESMAGPLPAEVLDVVCRLSDGSPFMASAVLRGLVESKALIAESQGWRVVPPAMADFQSSRHAASFLARRIQLLPRETVELLSVGAVLGKEFDLDTAAQLTRQTPPQAISALDVARRRHLVWVRPDGARCVFVHDKIRSVLLETLSGGQRQDVHWRAALHLQQHAPDRISDLAYHFDAAGETECALSYALEAAQQARAQHSLEVAEQQYRIAEHGAKSADKAVCYQIAEGLGDVLMLRGRYDAAAELFERAASLAEGRFARAQIRGKLAELAFKRGDMESATQDFETALRLLGRFVPRRLPVVAALLAWEVAVQALHTYFPFLFVHRRKTDPTETERLALRLFSNLAHGCWYSRSKIMCMWTHLRGLNLAERYPPTLELAHAYSEHGPGMSLIPLFRRAIRYSQKSLEIRKSCGDLWGQGQSLHYYGCVLYAASRFAECVEKCREAVRLLERMGDYWQVHIARYQIAASLYHLGDLRGAVEEARCNYRSGLELGDEQASGIILDVWARATGGAIPKEILQKELQRERHDAQGTAQVLLAQGVCLLGTGELDRAEATFEKAIDVADRAGVRNAYVLPNLAWLATARRRQAEKVRCAPAQRRRRLRRAEAAACGALRAARICTNDLPHALREYALILALQGKTRRARRLFDKSLAEAQRRDAWYEHAQTLLVRGKVGQELGWPGADQQVVEAETALRGLPVSTLVGESQSPAAGEPVSLSLADRFDTVLDLGRRIASALSPAAIHGEARTAALRLLRGERCLVLQIDRGNGKQELTPIQGELDGGFNRRIVDRALQAGRAVSLVEEIADDTSPSAVYSGECSSLCVPVFVRGRATVCLYVTHRHVRGLFGPDEERLADFIAAIAGAALENAEGFQELQRLNETLEQRVAERTAAAQARASELGRSNQELQRVANELRQTEEQLRVAIEEAETANRFKSLFLANMSHEIRTPMTAILGYAEVLHDDGRELGEDERQGYLEIIHTSSQHLVSLINDILDLSKIEAGQMEFDRVPCSPYEIIVEVVSALRVRAREKHLHLECTWSDGVPETIHTDPSRMRQLLINLVGNAIKFTHQGSVRIVVRLLRSEENPQLAVDVIDTGIGIPASRLESIFDPFVQADISTTREFGGTGLGLAICRRIVEALDGMLTVRSDPGRGSIFTATIATGPLQGVKILQAPPTGEPAARKPQPPKAPVALPPAKILLVEDGDTNRKLISLILTRAGAQVTTAENGQIGVELALKHPFDLILMDVQMPVMDGYTATTRLREQGVRLPILALTAYAMKGDAEKCKAAGYSGYLPKPVETRLLLRTIAQWLAAADPADSAAECPSEKPAPLSSSLPTEDPAFREIVEEFVELLGGKLDAMRRAWAAQDLSELARLAHWLKGTGGMAGFDALTQLAKRLEQLARDQRCDQIEEALAELVDLAGRIVVSSPSTA